MYFSFLEAYFELPVSVEAQNPGGYLKGERNSRSGLILAVGGHVRSGYAGCPRSEGKSEVENVATLHQ